MFISIAISCTLTSSTATCMNPCLYQPVPSIVFSVRPGGDVIYHTASRADIVVTCSFSIPFANLHSLFSSMPVRFSVAPHSAEPVSEIQRLQKPQELLDSTWGRKTKGSCAELLQSSVQAPAHWPQAQAFKKLDTTTPAGNEITPKAQYLASLAQQSTDRDFAQLRAQSNGFIDTVVHAYNDHHHLILR